LTFADPITLDHHGQQLVFRMIAESFTFISDPLLILTGPGQKKAPWWPPGRGRAGDTERTSFGMTPEQIVPLRISTDNPPQGLASSSSCKSIPDLIEWLNLQADRLDRRALAHLSNGPEFLRFRRMAAAARDTADWYKGQLRGEAANDTFTTSS
jgi:hypothetical protein